MKKLGKKLLHNEETIAAFCYCVCGCTTSDPSVSDWVDDYVSEGK